MFCPNCHANIANGSAFCTNCGTRIATTAAPASAPVGGYAAGAYASAAPKGTSYWDGGVLETFAASIVASLITTLTCGLGAPWAICYTIKFIVSHAVINGKRLKFNGDGASLFGNWLVWLLLTICTCGIYSFWVTPKLYNWIAKNTEIED